ncbi:hypothetical protein HYV49_00700 [Candidatus Pacearchaeota archaeon]|nr:hypothetical protein [Candidatus Pacearchaeota archaeon]
MKKENQISKKGERSAKYTPTLNTLIMVENTLKNIDKNVNMPELKNRLPKQVNHYTLIKILNYLEESKKIAVSMKGIRWDQSFGGKKELQRGYIN